MRSFARFFSWLLLLGLTLPASPVVAAPPANGALAAFAELVVGEWKAADSRHVLEWGVGQTAIRSRGYFMIAGEWKLVSEGLWYADPAGEGVRGIVVATDMPVTLFEYHSRVRDQTVVHDLLSHGEQGGRYVETWEFALEGYRWTLQQERDGLLAKIMGGKYVRDSGA